MIARRYIEEWKTYALWPDNAQIEQDLIIERSLTEMFSDDLIRQQLAFRGGTARIREILAFLGTKRTVKQHIHNNTIIYRFESEIPPVINMRLKIEINTREHLNILGLQTVPFKVENSWFSGECNITTYQMEELLATKLRALYQRRKGRDLFDLYWALTNHKTNIPQLLHCYREYMEYSVGKAPTKKIFLTNMEEKMNDKEFTDDIHVILRPGVEYENERAYELVRQELLENM